VRSSLGSLEHDNAKYPLDEKSQKEKKKGSKKHANGAALIPEIEDFDEGELKEVHSLFLFSIVESDYSL
jgi:pre-mRNA-splicing factor CDC5/CEF1